MKDIAPLRKLAGLLNRLPGAGIVRKGLIRADSKTRPYQLVALIAMRTAIDRQIERIADTPATTFSSRAKSRAETRSESIEIE